MKAFSFIHTADLHLDSPFKGISEISKEVSLELTEATFKTFDRIIDLCIEKQVDFLLVSGDIYDGEDRSLRAQLRFQDSLRMLSKAGIGAYIVYGNHDSLDGWSANLEWPENVHIFKGKSVENISVEKEGKEIARIYGISFHKRKIVTNLAHKFPKISKAEKPFFSIGMLHCNIGANTGHEPYAPCTLEDLIDLNFDYWALGHIHNNVIMNKENPVIIYPGNPQGLNPREIGARGCFLMEVDGKGKQNATFIEVDSVRWFMEDLQIDSLRTEQDLISKIQDCIEKIRKEADNRPSICRIVFRGRGSLHSIISRKGFLDDMLQSVRENELGEKQFVWVERFVDTTNAEIEESLLLQRKDFIGDLIRLFEEYANDKDKTIELNEYLESLYKSVSGRKFLKSVKDEHLIDLVKKAKTFCLDKLLRTDSDEI